MKMTLYVMARARNWKGWSDVPELAISDQNLSNLDDYHLLDEMEIEIPDFTDDELRAGLEESRKARVAHLKKELEAVENAKA
jgi:hypothetical protein